MTNEEARVWYNDAVRAVDTSGTPSRAWAKRISDARNALKRATRDAMADCEAAAKLDKEKPIQSFEYYEKKYMAEGYEGEALWRKIVESGTEKTNKAVNELYDPRFK